MLTRLKRCWPSRPNYRGETIPAAAGILFVIPALLFCGVLAFHADQQRAALMTSAAVSVFAALGLLDDCCGTREFGGIRGHLMALLQHGRVTTGLVKLFGGAAAALLLGSIAAPRWPEALLNGTLIALAANLINLLDLRPGRALKAFLFGGIVLAPAVGGISLLPLLAVALPAGCYAPLDLRARAMMGDTGSNALGAALGVTAALHLPLGGKLAILLVLTILQVASEFISFSKLIERNRVLCALDRWGRAA